jgi:hypothetical protein
MSYQQVRSFDQSKATSQKGYCLRNVRTGYGISPKYNSAWDSWINSTRRTTAIPSGVDVPCYFSYGRYGHIGVQLASGKFWSDGRTYSSLWAYRVTHPAVSYKGWSEEVNDVVVIKYVKAQTTMPAVGSKIQLIPRDTRTTFKNGTQTKAGSLSVTDNTFIYTIRAYDRKYSNRILINSRSAGGNGVALALYYTNGTRINGWKQI